MRPSDLSRPAADALRSGRVGNGFRNSGGVMKKHLVAALVLAAAPAIPALAQQDAPSSRSSRDSRIYEISAMISGTFEGVDARQSPDAPALARRDRAGAALRPLPLGHGQLRERQHPPAGRDPPRAQGDDIYFTYIPHFNPSVTVALAGRRPLHGARALLGVQLHHEARGRRLRRRDARVTACALAMRGAVGKWTRRARAGQHAHPQRRQRRDAEVQAESGRRRNEVSSRSEARS